ncbi:MAG: hypothetical protein ABI469_10725 [Gemmatimonadales bacterium]
MPHSLEDYVRTAFERATSGSGTPEELMSAVRVLVRNLESEGRRPEQVIVTVKRLCGLRTRADAADTDSNADISLSKRISDMVLRATIDEYYAVTLTSNSAPIEQQSGTPN